MADRDTRRHSFRADNRLPPPPSVEDEDPSETFERLYFFGVRLEVLAFGGVCAMIVGFAVLIYALGLDVDRMKQLGYLGLFLISFIGAASFILPMPGFAAVASGGALLDPVFGIPAPIMVGIVAGLAEAIGEFSGYAVGYSGSPVLERRRAYRLFHGWMRRHGGWALFGLAAIPNPLFDFAGMAAGAVRMRIPTFVVAVLAGKTLKSMYVAGAGAVIADLFFR